MGQNDLFVLLVIVAAVFTIKLLKGPLGQAIADRLRGGPPPYPGMLEELDAVKTRLAEVEERLDFAERMLAQGEQVERLPGRGET